MKIKYREYLFIILVFLFAFSACESEKELPQITIGISKGAPEKYYGNYTNWLKDADSTVICLDLYHMPIDSAIKLLENCSGLLISGGPDVYPGYYGRPEDTIKCGEIDHFRDSLEFALIEKALSMEMPVMGICRGLQIFNISQGGSLYADIPTDLDTLVTHRCPDIYNCFHEIRLEKGSPMNLLTSETYGIVNSNHHQGIRRIGEGLVATARTNEGLIEAISYKESGSKPFFMAVQWHPERMDVDNPFSGNIAGKFLTEATQWELNKSN